MYKNYFKIAIRDLLKNKVHSIINILGLAIGLATCMLILIFVFNEWSYDQFNTKSDLLHRLVQTTVSTEKNEDQASTPFLLGPVLEAEYPDQIEATVRFYNLEEPTHTILNREEEFSYTESNLFFVDSTFFEVFTTEMLQGNPEEALKNPSSLVISEDIAKKYFGNENPIGQTLNYRGIQDLTVTGVMANWPEESHMDLELLISFSTLNEIYGSSPDYDQSWHWNPVWTYTLLKEGTEIEPLQAQFASIAENYYYAYPGWPSDQTVDITLQPVTDIHLHSSRDNEMATNGSATYVNILLAVGIFILIIACINFMNLSTARSAERSREVGIRKVLGGHRSQLFYQFIGESFLITLLSIFVGVALVFLLVPYFGEIVDRDLSFSLFQNPYIIPGLFLLAVITGLFSGSYPALYLSSFKPSHVLKGNGSNGRNGTLLRKSLVTFQFTLSVILIIGTLVIYNQLQYIQNKDLGFDENQVLILPTKQNLIAWEFSTFKEQALSNAQIQSVAGIGKIIGNEKQEYYRFVPGGTVEGADGTNQALFVTHDFVETFDLEILAGRSFSKEFATDEESAVLINEKMLQRLGLESPDEAIGHEFYFYTSSNERETYQVVGVVNNFNYTSIKKEIEPLVIGVVEDTRRILGAIEYTAVEIAGGDASGAIAHLESVWEEVNHVDPFEYRFLDQELEQVYKTETVMSSMATSFTILCIIIACMGLLGLASHSAQLKRQEIGIRKSLGASISSIVGLLSKEFIWLVALANLIAWPVAWYFANSWLQNFPYRFDITTQLPLIFIGSGMLILLIAMVTVSFHAMKAANLNPVEAIRSKN
ncbi:ABC transporter permease [Gracilimonas mengyeensis]|uniref:Putative ABC transport system permease protein n=1 Tax=Gracilimonas mengyeensis TaxID=1302730 RepID=A0A521F6Q0_9BACT|nr:ABC transporter permease [Gracilimonas mengyeensis]SMO91898.1 putative ABC transport system permease protein [Gracilimonas mengyeensis]